MKKIISQIFLYSIPHAIYVFSIVKHNINNTKTKINHP
jgi:hypothetical protein